MRLLTQAFLGLSTLCCVVSSFYLLINHYDAWWVFMLAAITGVVALFFHDDTDPKDRTP